MNISAYRPGVYSQYTVRTLYAGRREGLRVGVVGALGLSTPLAAVTFTAGVSQLPPTATPLLKGLWDICFTAGVGELWCVSLPENPTADDMAAALGALDDTQVYAVACQYIGDQAAAKAAQWAQAQSAQQKERLVVMGGEDPALMADLAQSLNSERVVLTLGATAAGDSQSPLYGAAALAAAIGALEDPSVSLSGLQLPGITATTPLTLPQCDTLLEAGVTPLVNLAGTVECMRGVTTRTTDGAQPDRSLYPLNAILIIDHVMRNLRGTLSGLLKGAKNGSATLSAVASQVTVLLSSLQQAGIITGFGVPSVYTPSSDPGRCLVEVSFSAAYTINQICITAQVQL